MSHLAAAEIGERHIDFTQSSERKKYVDQCFDGHNVSLQTFTVEVWWRLFINKIKACNKSKSHLEYDEYFLIRSLLQNSIYVFEVFFRYGPHQNVLYRCV